MPNENTPAKPLRRPGRDDEADAIEAGIEAASEAVSALPTDQRAWTEKEHMIAQTAARVAVEDIWERMNS